MTDKSDEAVSDESLRLYGYDEWEQRAREVLSAGAFSHVLGGAGTEETIRSNRESFFRWKIVPRVLKDVAKRDLTTNLFGSASAAPIIIAPVGNRDAILQDGELITARAAESLGVPFVLGTFTTVTLEDVARAMGGGTRWFQLYPGKDNDVMASFVRRAESAGYSALVITVDEAGSYPRYRVLRSGFTPADMGVGIYFSDPVFRAKLERTPEVDKASAMDLFRKTRYTSGITWADVERIKNETRLPVVLKGLLHPSDAELALSHGVDGIIVSNHGGRRIDGEVAAIDLLPKICDVIQGRMPVLMDSGVRNGADAVKALALGARAVLIGRAHLYGLAVGGQKGVERVVSDLMREMNQALAICGCRTPGELDRSLVMHY